MGLGSSAPTFSQQQRVICKYIRMSPLCIALNDVDIEAFATCFEIIELEAGNDLGCLISNSLNTNENFFIVCDGQIDVSIKLPSSNKKTDYIREILHSKKEGDMLYLPSIEHFVERYEASAAKWTSRHIRRTSKKLAALLRLKDSERRKRPLHATNNFVVPRRESDTQNYQMKSDKKEKNAGKVLKYFSLTDLAAPYGAILLRLNRMRFNVLEAEHIQRQCCLTRLNSRESQVKNSTPQSKANKNTLVNCKDRNMESTDRLTVSLEGQLQKHAELKTVSDFCLLRVMMTSNIQDYLKRIPFLTKVPMTKIQMIGEMSRFETFEKGCIVCREGSKGDRVYVIVYGELAVCASRESPSFGK